MYWISNGYITVAAEEVQRHYRAHHRYTIWVRAFCTRRRHDTMDIIKHDTRCQPAANHSSADVERQTDNIATSSVILLYTTVILVKFTVNNNN